ncbi:transcriptional regulator with XRE-family HTH domain [Chryseobacterium defluvii]|uniref:Transcriptional regulator with XRE-family HTH domain n=1 Tax=Chryseobacterium defluvii TaxID=160396 RepID=A0A840KJS5_9FLAO|nr:helix-turn-helix transcriptional regulator [Chryseobacterium defluvii]MBB4808167.1 transcriptional regulator with XRE-family HTH domain [Chryseobacterium defluvii]
MQKEKLRAIRKKKGYTQQQIADIIATDVSNYSRKESGDVKIIKDEWEKIANFLEVSVEDIYEDEDSKVVINNEYNTISENSGFYNLLYGNNTNYNIPNSMIDNLQDYIKLLKEENNSLKEELKALKGKK